MAVTPTIDEAKLEAFMERSSGRWARARPRPWSSSATSWASTRPWRTRGPSRRRELAERTGTRALYPRMALPAGRERIRRVRRRGRHLPAAARAGDRARGRREPGVHPGGVPAAGSDDQGRAGDHRALPLRRRLRLARASSRPVRGHRAVLPPGLQRAPRRRRGCRRSTASRSKLRGRRPRRRHRLRPRRLDDPDGAGLPGVHVRRLRLPRGFDRGRPPRRGARPRRRSRHLRGRRREGVRRRPVRPRLRVRRAARHGRPGRRGAARAHAAGRWRHVAGRRAVWRATRSRRTSTRSGASSTRARRCSARRPRSARRSGSRSAPRPGRSG